MRAKLKLMAAIGTGGKSSLILPAFLLQSRRLGALYHYQLYATVMKLQIFSYVQRYQCSSFLRRNVPPPPEPTQKFADVLNSANARYMPSVGAYGWTLEELSLMYMHLLIRILSTDCYPTRPCVDSSCWGSVKIATRWKPTIKEALCVLYVTRADSRPSFSSPLLSQLGSSSRPWGLVHSPHTIRTSWSLGGIETFRRAGVVRWFFIPV